MPLTKIQSLGITDGTIVNADINASAAITTSKLSGGTNTPAFMAYNLGVATQSIATTAWTEITIYDTELFDTNSAFNTTTSRFTPQVAGKYVFFASVYYTQTTAGTFIGITKNGVITGNTSDNFLFQTDNVFGMTGSCILNLNGTTDYVSAYTLHASGTSKTIGGGTYNSFYGYRLIGV